MNAYHRPRSLDAALETLGQAPCLVLAGGTDVFPADASATAWGRAAIDHPAAAPILDLSAVAGLAEIARAGGQVVIGAGVTWTQAIESRLPAWFDGVRAAGREVGGRQIQNRGTLAGNLCNASPAADGVPALLALDARVRLQRRGHRRELPLAEFITGNRQTRLGSGELLTAILIPEPDPGLRSTFLKLGARRYLVISIAMAAVSLRVAADAVAQVRVAVGACSAVACRLPALEARLAGAPVSAATGMVRAADFAGLSPLDDVRGSADFRRHAARVLVQRALGQLATSAAGRR